MIIMIIIVSLIVQRPILSKGCLTFLHWLPAHPTKAFWPRAWWLKPNACNQWKLFHTLRTHHEANDGDDEELHIPQSWWWWRWLWLFWIQSPCSSSLLMSSPFSSLSSWSTIIIMITKMITMTDSENAIIKEIIFIIHSCHHRTHYRCHHDHDNQDKISWMIIIKLMIMAAAAGE